MKKLIATGILCLATSFLWAQKKPLDHSVYDDWKHISNPAITPKGEMISFQIEPQEGDGRLVFQLTKENREIIIDRGYNAAIIPGNKFAVCLVKPLFQETRQAKIDKKKPDQMPKDSLAVISLKDGSITRFGNVQSYRIGEKSAEEIAFLSADTTLIEKADRKKKNIGKPLIIYRFNNGKCDTLRYVDKYAFNKPGTILAYTTLDKEKKASVELYLPADRTTTRLAEGNPFYSLPEFNEAGDQLLFLSSADSTSTGTKHCELYSYEVGASEAKVLINKEYRSNLPDGWSLNENSRPFFSKDSQRIFFGVAPQQAPKDTTLVEFETAALDLWHYAEPQIQPVQLKNLQRDRKRTCLATYHAEKKELIPLATSFFDRITLMDEGNAPLALSVDKTNYTFESQWNTRTPGDISLVNLLTGERTAVTTGVFSHLAPSPNGKHLIWYNYADSQWYIYNIQQKETHCLTRECEVNFWNEEHDTPNYAPAYGIAGWTENDAEVLLYDRYDIWKLTADGSSAINITQGKGRANHQTFRYLNPKPNASNRDENRGYNKKEVISSKHPLLLSVFDQTTKKHGYATLRNLSSASPALAVLDGFTFSNLRKAEESDIYVYQKANFQTSPDLYVTHNLWKSEKKISDINPQMKDYLWGTSELYQWNAYDGTPLEGILYKPENFDPTRKYPVILYFYEKKSDDLYSYYAPAPSRSTINISFYCSRGYLVFTPDIVYNAGIPGENAYNCIVSGAEALAQNPWVDRENMAIQGQSWGGYQVSYLVTRTNMFKAAGAGAPVSNMTSAYGGIRWGTGLSRQYQYEQTQSRIGQTLWEAPELYIANSPVFKANRVETPLLIMHNDNDGAVPWYQGIEYFMALRRLGKPVWMLQYNKEEHNLVERRNMKDLAIRWQQFFDHYLKGDPMPAWMKNGIPASRKGEYFGFETE